MTKVIKNPNRHKVDDIKPYVPNYRKLNIEPAVVDFDNSNNDPIDMVQGGTTDDNNPRLKTLIAPENNSVPNVGNNIEHTWAGVDGEIIDYAEIDMDHEMIDNNDYVTVPNDHVTVPDELKNFLSKEELDKLTNSCFNFSSLDEDTYILLIDNNVVLTGDLDVVQNEIRKLLMPKEGLPISGDITVLKKVKVKIGIFLE